MSSCEKASEIAQEQKKKYSMYTREYAVYDTIQKESLKGYYGVAVNPSWVKKKFILELRKLGFLVDYNLKQMTIIWKGRL